ncbi:MAG: hypothetical protein HAW59_03615, partial [Betaproteobacteria bacterium]|nr:hypothetical protein [Betaproteobacteria bacterium]
YRWFTGGKLNTCENAVDRHVAEGYGGQTALNCALDLERHGVLKKHGVEMIGAKKEAIDKAEDRDLFRAARINRRVVFFFVQKNGPN